MTTTRERRLGYLSWAAVCVIWGTTYLGIRICLESMPPALMGGLRWTIAGSLLIAYLLARGEAFPPPSRWGGIALLGFLLIGIGNGGVVFAEQWVPSGLAAVLVAVAPFWMAGVEAALPDGERLNRATVFGLLVGFSGILVLVWPDLTIDRGADRRFLAGVVALQMLAGGLIMIAAGTARSEWQHLFFTSRTATSLLYLSTLGAIGGFVAYSYALRHLPVSFVSLYAYINPVIAVTLGVMLLGEPFDARMATAAALVFAGVAVVRWRPSTRLRSFGAGPGSADPGKPQPGGDEKRVA